VRVPTKLAAYGAVLAAALAGGALFGAAVGPIDGDDPVESEPVDVTSDPVHDVHPTVVRRGAGFDR